MSAEAQCTERITVFPAKNQPYHSYPSSSRKQWKSCYTPPMATHWDDIYKEYEKGGEAWATLSEGIHPQFPPFIEHTDFPLKHALDIGCGTGSYLKFLKDAGFDVDGLDNSETALSMTRELIPNAHLAYADMHTWQIPPDQYDLILSVSTIHHGMKDEAAAIVRNIHDALPEGGHIFIVIPEWESRKDWPSNGTHELLAPGVMAPLTGPEKGLAHCFYTEAEARALFKDFSNLKLELDSYTRWVVTGSK